MQLEDYFDFLAPDDIRIKGHRIGIENVLYEFVHKAKTPDELQRRFPSLTLEEIYATILYYLHNKEAVSKYLAEWIEHGERMRAEQDRNPPPGLRWLQQPDTQKMIVEARAKYETHE